MRGRRTLFAAAVLLVAAPSQVFAQAAEDVDLAKKLANPDWGVRPSPHSFFRRNSGV
jgi:hypothetical protein